MEGSAAPDAVIETTPIAEVPARVDMAGYPDSAGQTLRTAADRFAAFAAHHGETFCGPPLAAASVEAGVVVQYFRNLALELGPEGQVSPRPLGALAFEASRHAKPLVGMAAPGWTDVRGLLPVHQTLRYPHRPLAQIRYLVLHHSGVTARHDARQIADEHVHANGWPGIGYHFVIGYSGLIEHCQDLTVSSHHVAQFNPVAVGIALLGDLRTSAPGPRQLEATADLLAWLRQDLGLPRQAIRGHGEMVSTDCPGRHFLDRWKPQLLEMVGNRFAAPSLVASVEQDG